MDERLLGKIWQRHQATRVGQIETQNKEASEVLLDEDPIRRLAEKRLEINNFHQRQIDAFQQYLDELRSHGVEPNSKSLHDYHLPLATLVDGTEFTAKVNWSSSEDQIDFLVVRILGPDGEELDFGSFFCYLDIYRDILNSEDDVILAGATIEKGHEMMLKEIEDIVAMIKARRLAKMTDSPLP